MARKKPGIRETIQLLSGILATNCGIPKIPSETFRLAKFNKPEVAETFRQVLARLVQLAMGLESGDVKLGRGGTSWDAATELSLLAVRRHLVTLGYHRQAFFIDVDEDGPTSRELLLATIWVLYRTQLIPKLTSHHIKMAARRELPMKPRQQVVLEEEERGISLVAMEIQTVCQDATRWTDVGRLSESVRKLIWLRGNLQGGWRTALNTQHAYQKMAHSLHTCTTTPSPHPDHSAIRRHLGVHELYLLRHPDQLAAYLGELEWRVGALQTLVQWPVHEEVFWRWGESILDLQDKEERALLNSQVRTELPSGILTKEECTADLLGREQGAVDQHTREKGDTKFKDEPGTEKKVFSVERLSNDIQRLEREIGAHLDKNRPHIERLRRVWAMKSHGLPAHEVGIEEDRMRRRYSALRGWVCRPVQTSRGLCGAVEELSALDCAVYLPASDPQTRPSARGWERATQEEEEAVGGQLLKASEERLAQARTALTQTQDTIRLLQSELITLLSALERQLLPNICRVVPEMKHLSKTQVTGSRQ